MDLYFSLPPLLSLSGFFGLGLLINFKAPRNRTNKLFIWICLLSSLLYLDILYAFNTGNRIAALWISRMDHLFVAFLVPLYLDFFHSYLGEKPPRFLIPAAHGIAFLFMCLALTPWYISDMARYAFGFFAKAGPLYPLFGIIGVAATAYVSMLVYRVVRKEPEAFRKKQLWFVFAGFGGLGVLNGLNFFPIHGVCVYPPGNFAFIPMALFAYGLSKHNLLHTDTFINRGLVYSVLTASLTCLYALIVTLMTKLFSRADVFNSVAFPFFFFLLVAIVFGPLKLQIQHLIDRFFFRKKYDYQQALKRISKTIVSVLNMDAIGNTLIQTVVDTMRVRACRLVVTPADGRAPICFSYPEDPQSCIQLLDQSHPLLRCLFKEQNPVEKQKLYRRLSEKGMAAVFRDMTENQVELAVPLIFKNQLNGYFLLGPKYSGEPFSREDIDLLETLSGQSALAIENARSYQRVDELNRKLEEKVVARTQALQQALEEKERTQEKLIRSESLAAIGQLVAGVAHELNNPLTSTVSLVQSSIEDLNDDVMSGARKETIEDLKFADKELRRARNIVTSLLSLSRQTDTYSEAVELNEVIRDALRVLYNQYKYRTFTLLERYAEDLPEIQGNFAGLGQVVLNIVQNAFQAMAGRDTVVELVTAYDRENRNVLFKCLDSGPGIPPSIRKDIFNPFFTTKAPGKGTGLGLYLCYEIVRKHSGELFYTDHDGGGAGFIMILPVKNEYAE
ncbi:MAG: ATP-binding protein [Desulfobacterales bacterium]|jgi:two-component system NtrC family sensor kinase|nr:ATP-binding protein [Desulfobacterales bacterium]